MRTWWQRLLKFLGALRVLQDEGVEVLVAPNLELDLVVLLVLLYPRGFTNPLVLPIYHSVSREGANSGVRREIYKKHPFSVRFPGAC